MIAKKEFLDDESLTRHRKIVNCYDYKGKLKGDVKSKCINTNSTFDIILRLKNDAKFDMQLYENLMKLSFYLFGMGKRTRRARGCVCIDEQEQTAEKTKADILCLLNEIAANAGQENKQKVYRDKGDYIEPCIGSINTYEKRPVIQRISFGSIVKANNINQFLTNVDATGHDVKSEKSRDKDKDATGSVKFASAIIVSVAKITKGYLPIYTYVKAVIYHGKELKDHRDLKELDEKLEQRSQFQEKVESGRTVK